MKVDFADIKPSVLNAAMFGLTALLVIPLMKYILAKWPVPGLSDLAGAI